MKSSAGNSGAILQTANAQTPIVLFTIRNMARGPNSQKVVGIGYIIMGKKLGAFGNRILVSIDDWRYRSGQLCPSSPVPT